MAWWLITKLSSSSNSKYRHRRRRPAVTPVTCLAWCKQWCHSKSKVTLQRRLSNRKNNPTVHRRILLRNLPNNNSKQVLRVQMKNRLRSNSSNRPLNCNSIINSLNKVAQRRWLVVARANSISKNLSRLRRLWETSIYQETVSKVIHF